MDAMGHVRFNLVYDGPALQQHQMDVRDLAPALLAMGELVDRANEMFNGTQAKVGVNVHASFQTGSFGIDLDLVQSLWQRVLDLSGSQTVTTIKDLVELLGLVGTSAAGVIKVVRWLRGRGVQKIDLIAGGNARLWVDNDYIDVEDRVLKLLQDYKIRKGLEKLIAVPLERDGIDTFATVDRNAKQVMVEIDRTEARYFTAPPPIEEALEETEYEATLQVLNLAFKDDNKWRFTEGGTAFYATILDEEFLRRVALNQEQFAKDDLLRARLRRTQRLSATEGLKADYVVLEVLEHRSASPKVQLRIDYGPTDPPIGEA